MPAPTDEVLHAVLHRIITRTMKLLTHRGLRIEEQDQTLRIRGVPLLQREAAASGLPLFHVGGALTQGLAPLAWEGATLVVSPAP